MLAFFDVCALFLTVGEVFQLTAVRGGILDVTVVIVGVAPNKHQAN